MNQIDSTVKKCLEELKSVFTVNDFKNILSKAGIPDKNPHRVLGKLVKQRYVKKIDRSTYQKITDIHHLTLEFFKDLITDCQNSNNIQEINKYQFIHKTRTVYFVGVPENHQLPEWKEEILNLLLNRMIRIYESIDYLVTDDHSEPPSMPNYLRLMMTELIAYHLDLCAHLDFYKLQNEVEALISIMTQRGHDTSEIVDMFDKIKKWIDGPKDREESCKITDKFGMIFSPPLYLLDPDSDAENSILDRLKGINDGRSEETIVAEMATWEDLPHVETILEKYKDAFDAGKITRINQLYEKIQLGRKVAPLLYSVDFYLKILKGLKNKTLIEGTYVDGEQVDGEQYPEVFNNSIDGCLIFDVVLESHEFIIPSKESCEEELSKNVEELEKIKKNRNIKMMIESAIFQNKIKLFQGYVIFRVNDLDCEEIFEQLGCRHHAKDVPQWSKNATMDASRFVKSWIKRNP